MFPAGVASTSKTVQARRRAAAATLIDLHQTYRASFKGAGRTPAAAVAPSKGAVAAHGFMNLPPQLVKALSGTDTGRLVWLGTGSVHDFMHFELGPGDLPPLF
jgi:hypothetical protein